MLGHLVGSLGELSVVDAFAFASTRLRLRGTRSAVSHGPTKRAARMHTQSVSQATTEDPVLQIWTDQSPQP